MKFWREIVHTYGNIATIITVLSAVAYGSRALATKEDLEKVREMTPILIERSQSAQNAYFEEYIKNASSSAADNAARKTIREWIQITGIRNSKTRPYFKDSDDE